MKTCEIAGMAQFRSIFPHFLLWVFPQFSSHVGISSQLLAENSLLEYFLHSLYFFFLSQFCKNLPSTLCFFSLFLFLFYCKGLCIILFFFVFSFLVWKTGRKTIPSFNATISKDDSPSFFFPFLFSFLFFPLTWSEGMWKEDGRCSFWGMLKSMFRT